MLVIPKEIRRTMRIREGEPLDNSLTLEEKFAIAVHSILAVIWYVNQTLISDDTPMQISFSSNKSAI